MLQALARLELDWPRVAATLTDERWVEPDCPGSRQRWVEEVLLVGPAGRARFVPMKTSAISPLAGIGRYIRALGAVPLPLDAVLLTLGDDGGFAGLFPRSKALSQGLDIDAALRCVAVPAGDHGEAPGDARLSLTLSMIAKARRIVMLAHGDDHLGLLRRVLAAPCNPIAASMGALLAARPDTVVLHSPACIRLAALPKNPRRPGLPTRPHRAGGNTNRVFPAERPLIK